MRAEHPTHVLRIACPDATGLIHPITGVLFDAGLNIVANGEFVDPHTNLFYMRTEFGTPPGAAAGGGAPLADRIAAVLPAFTGARPYAQAFERGVKIIGATAHFVTEGLDAGPIIAQSVLSVDHTHSAADMALAGRDVEKVVLARALRLVFEDRVFVAANRTILFD